MYTFRKDERLCNKKIIGDLYASDNRLLVYPLSVHWLITEQKHPCRLQVLIVAPKKKLHHAVDRNRTKRLMRECYRHRKHLLLETLEQKNLSTQIAQEGHDQTQNGYCPTIEEPLATHL